MEVRLSGVDEANQAPEWEWGRGSQVRRRTTRSHHVGMQIESPHAQYHLRATLSTYREQVHMGCVWCWTRRMVESRAKVGLKPNVLASANNARNNEGRAALSLELRRLDTLLHANR